MEEISPFKIQPPNCPPKRVIPIFRVYSRIFGVQIRDDAGHWVDKEFETLDLGDPLRDRHAKELVKRFASWPTAKKLRFL